MAHVTRGSQPAVGSAASSGICAQEGTPEGDDDGEWGSLCWLHGVIPQPHLV